MNWSGAVFVLSFLATVYFMREAIKARRSQEFRRDLERLAKTAWAAEKKPG